MASGEEEVVVPDDKVYDRIMHAIRFTANGDEVARIYNRLNAGPELTYNYASVKHGDHTFTEKKR